MKLKILFFALLLLAACRETTMEEPYMAIEIRSQLGDVLLSGNPIWVDTDDGGSQPAGSTNYQHLLRIVSTDGALIGSPMIDAIAPEADHMAHFNIQGRVDQDVDYDFQFPQQNLVTAFPLLAFDITLEAGERYVDSNGDLQTSWSGVTESHRILKGGISRLITQDIQPYRFYDDFIRAGRFLTWQAPDMKISPDTPLMLWYIYPPESYGANVELRITVFRNNEVGYSDEKVYEITLLPDNLYAFNLSLDVLGLTTTHATYGNVTGITAGIYSSGVLKSELRSWFYDLRNYDENTYIAFKNSLSGVDCLWCTGKLTEILSTEKSVSARPDLPTINHKRATQVVSSVQGQRKWELNTGHKSKEDLSAMRDFALSDQMWLLRDTYVIPVYLENRDHVLAQISRNLDDISITLLEGHIENKY